MKRYAGLETMQRADKVLENFFRENGGTNHLTEDDRQLVCEMILQAFDSQIHVDIERVKELRTHYHGIGKEDYVLACVDLIKRLEG